jgi:site-specific DNA recombinase
MTTMDLKRAVSYLRVSTKAQAVRDGNPEGYSLPTQRAEAQRKAALLGAVVVEEYIDKDSGTRTDMRPALQALLRRVQDERDIDYVIVFKLDRWARNAREDLVNDYILEQADAELVSCSEPIDRTNHGRMMHIMLAGNAEYMSRNSGDDIKRKILIKVQEGGTHGPARIGYKNVGEGQRRWIEIDPEVASLIRWCFVTYATGEWSVKRLLVEATERGLLSKGGPNSPRKPIGQSQMHRILANPYYKGIVVFNGIAYEGKHEPLVDAKTWQRVQDVLASKANGEKQREHHHYLKGTIYCGHCGSRLVVTYARGKLGTRYPYYICVGRQQRRTPCTLRARRIELVEDQLIQHYRKVKLDARGIQATADAIVNELSDQQANLSQLQQHQKNRLKLVAAEQSKLMQAHYADAIPLDVLKAEQARLNSEKTQLVAALKATKVSEMYIRANAEAAVDLLSDCYRTYQRMKSHERRLMNQAFFKQVWITEEGIVAWEYNEPFATLMRQHGVPEPHLIVEYKPTPQSVADDELEAELHREITRRSSGQWASASLVLCLKQNNLAEREGFEPSDPVTQVNSLAVNPIRPLSHLSRRASLGHTAIDFFRRTSHQEGERRLPDLRATFRPEDHSVSSTHVPSRRARRHPTVSSKPPPHRTSTRYPDWMLSMRPSIHSDST